MPLGLSKELAMRTSRVLALAAVGLFFGAAGFACGSGENTASICSPACGPGQTCSDGKCIPGGMGGAGGAGSSSSGSSVGGDGGGNLFEDAGCPGKQICADTCCPPGEICGLGTTCVREQPPCTTNDE